VQHGEFAGAVVARLAVALAAREIDVEHVDLVVARDDLAARIDQEGAVGGLVGRDLDGRSRHEPNRMRAKLAERRQAGILSSSPARRTVSRRSP
jgi:hypothetical protein